MTENLVFLAAFHETCKSMWTQDRLQTLGRIAVQGRQFENWWKFELATALWEFATARGAKVFIEAHGRADIVVCSYRQGRGGVELDPAGALCVPIELKTTGTWWGNVRKALEETGADRLATDFDDLAKGARTVAPFGLVGLLLTDATHGPKALERFVSHAIALGESFGLKLVSQDVLQVPRLYTNCQPLARQLFWANP